MTDQPQKTQNKSDLPWRQQKKNEDDPRQSDESSMNNSQSFEPDSKQDYQGQTAQQQADRDVDRQKGAQKPNYSNKYSRANDDRQEYSSNTSRRGAGKYEDQQGRVDYDQQLTDRLKDELNYVGNQIVKKRRDDNDQIIESESNFQNDQNFDNNKNPRKDPQTQVSQQGIQHQQHIQMEESRELLISNSVGQVTLIGLKEQLDKLDTLTKSIQVFHQMQHESLEQHIMCFENDYILKCVFQNLGQLQLLVPPQIFNKQLLIRGDQKQIQGAVETIKQIIENVQQQMKQETVQMTELESKYLQKHHQNDLTHIQNTFDCLISEPTLVQGGQQNQQQIQMQQQQPNWYLHQAQQPATTYQWSWNDDGNTLVDYALEINGQIDHGYATFLQDYTKNTIDVNFPPEMTPGTHSIDLSTMILTDLTLQSTAQLSQSPDGTYVLAGQLQPDEITNFINQKITQGQIKFDIFLKNDRIIFFDAQTAVQVNIETGQSRYILKSLLYYDPQPFPVNLLQQVTNHAPLPSYLNDTHLAIYEIRSQKKEKLDQALKEFKKLLESLQEKQQIRLPNIDEDSRFDTLLGTILDKSIRIDGEIKPDRLIEITTFKEYMNQIQSLIQVIPNFGFPPEWESYDGNLIRIELKQNDQEYILIKGKFQQTYPAGQITAIFRIQNKHLYTNYVREQNDMIKRNQDRGTPLTADEKEQLLWHGVRSGHPKLIYNGNKEGFDGTYANKCMWGTGIYFSTRADYSVRYSWTLQQQDGPTHQGHKVFLCCKVATGRAFDCYPDNTLQRPPHLPLPNQDTCYDSVTGNSQGTKMDVRRAYPAYEVIYQ